MAERPPWRGPLWLEVIVLGAVAALLAWFLYGLWHDRRLAGDFERIRLGMDRPAVEAVLGGPDWEGACGSGRALSLPREGCRRELGYSSHFAFLVPRHHVVQLDSSGRVVEAETIGVR